MYISLIGSNDDGTYTYLGANKLLLSLVPDLLGKSVHSVESKITAKPCKTRKFTYFLQDVLLSGSAACITSIPSASLTLQCFGFLIPNTNTNKLSEYTGGLTLASGLIPKYDKLFLCIAHGLDLSDSERLDELERQVSNTSIWSLLAKTDAKLLLVLASIVLVSSNWLANHINLEELLPIKSDESVQQKTLPR